VVEARADHPEGDAPDRDPGDELPLAALRNPALAGQPDARKDRDEQRQPVHVERQRADVDDAGVRARNEGEHPRKSSRFRATGRTWLTRG